MTNQTNQLGRPRVIDNTVTTKLSVYLREGCSVVIACRQSGISTTTYYEELARNPDFADKMRAAEDIMDAMAMKHVYHALTRDLATAKWWITRQDKREANAL